MRDPLRQRWIPPLGRGDDDVVGHLPVFPEAATQAGRNPDEMEITVYACPPDKEFVQRYADAGITRGVFGPPPPGRDVVLGFLDMLAPSAGARLISEEV